MQSHFVRSKLTSDTEKSNLPFAVYSTDLTNVLHTVHRRSNVTQKASKYRYIKLFTPGIIRGVRLSIEASKRKKMQMII